MRLGLRAAVIESVGPRKTEAKLFSCPHNSLVPGSADGGKGGCKPCGLVPQHPEPACGVAVTPSLG